MTNLPPARVLPPQLQEDPLLLEWLQDQWRCGEGVGWGSNEFGDSDWLNFEADCNLSDADWEKIGKLKFARGVSIHSADLALQALSRLTAISDLESIQLVDVDLTWDVARLLSGFPKLRHLFLVPSGAINAETPGAEIDTAAVRELAKHVALVSLTLDRSVFHPSALAEAAAWKSLENLSLCGSTVDDEGLRCVGQMHPLMTLDLMRTAISSAGLRHLTGLSRLASLRVDEAQLDDRAMESIELLSELVDLNLRESGISADGLLKLKGLFRLQRLNLSSMPATDSVAAVIGRLTQLTELTLRATPITDQGVATLAGLRNLESLSLDETRISDAGLAMIVQSFPSLVRLSVDQTAVSDAGLLQLTALKHLESISFYETEAQGACYDQLRQMPTLKYLSHSHLPLLRRQRNFFRYQEEDHVIDWRNSTLDALIDIKESGIERFWILEIRCTPEGIPWTTQPANLQEVILRVPFTDWRSFAGRQFQQGSDLFDDQEPVANLYTGLHDAVSKLRIRFGKRNGRCFRFRISGIAEGGRFLADGVLRVSQVIVRDWVEERGDVERARSLATAWFRPDELGNPSVEQGWVTFPIKTTD